MPGVSFDLAALFGAIEEERGERGLSWAALSREVGVAPSTIRRFGEADDAEADGVLALIRWVAATPEHFVAGAATEGEYLPARGEGVVRVDMNTIRDSPGGAGIPLGRTRTTIQRLVEAAHETKRPIASFTRLSDG